MTAVVALALLVGVLLGGTVVGVACVAWLDHLHTRQDTR